MRICTHRTLLIFALLARFGLSDATHASDVYSHARRSLKLRAFEARQDIPVVPPPVDPPPSDPPPVIPPPVDPVPPPPGDPAPPPSESSTTSILPPVSVPPASESTSSSNSVASASESASSAPQTAPASAGTATSSSTSAAPASVPTQPPVSTGTPPAASASDSGTITSPATSASASDSASAPPPSSSASCTDLLGCIVSILSPSSSSDPALAPASAPPPPASDTASVPPTTTSATVVTDTTATVPTSAAPASVPVPSDPLSAPASASATATTSDCGLLCIVSSILDPPATSAPVSEAPTSSAPPPPPITETASVPTTSSDCGLLCSVTSDLLPPPPPTTTASETSQPVVSVPVSESEAPPTIVVPTSSVVPSVPPEPSLPESVLPTSTTIVVSFPSSASDTATAPAESSSEPHVAGPTATISTATPSEFAFLSGSTLVFTSVSTTNAAAATLTNPDEPTSTFSLIDSSAAVLPSQAVLPTGTPGRIVPPNGVDPATTNLNGYTLISILFNQQLNWDFVSKNQIASSQILAYFPLVVQNALGITSDQVKTFALQVWVPATYQGPDDVNELGTMWLAYIPTPLVDTLAAQIKAKQSPFYTGTSGIGYELAARVDASFSLNSVPNPQSSLPNTGSPQSAPANSGSLAKTRQNAIIGVVTTLGAIALLILAVLVVRSFKRRREQGHHRLSGLDPTAGLRPEGRDFDEDSIGGQRRRSFYFAEDSLRAENERQQQQSRSQGAASGLNQMTQRRVVPGAISAPILTGSSMNW